MNHDDRLTRYLSDQAEGIALPPADPASVMRRGSRRRARRRAGFVGGLAVVAVLGATLAVRDPGSDQQVDVAPAANVAVSSYDWDTVVPRSGLGFGERTAQLADGSLFGISTAPGPFDGDDPEAALAPTLYRSTDGTEWAAASLPSGMRTADLAGAGATLYSVGTAPAGGLVLASTTDGASSWSSTELPGDLAALRARHGAKVVVSTVRVAAADAAHVVVTAVAQTTTDLTAYRPEVDPGRHAWRWDDAGVTVYEIEEVPCTEEAGVVVDRRAGDGDPGAAPGAMVCRVTPADPEKAPGREVARYSFDDLGIDAELREHLGGKVYAYVTDDGSTFERVSLPADAGTPPEALFAATPLATPDGYRLVLGTSQPFRSSTVVLRSADGRTWEHAASLSGSASGVGLLAGRPAVGLYDDDGRSTVRIEQPDGTWSELDLSQAVTTPAGSETWMGSFGFGPLGLAAVVGTTDGDGDTVEHLVHTDDGHALQVLPVGDVVDEGTVTGIVVTADAIVARLSHGSDDDPSTPPTQTVLVGTPAG